VDRLLELEEFKLTISWAIKDGFSSVTDIVIVTDQNPYTLTTNKGLP